MVVAACGGPSPSAGPAEQSGAVPSGAGAVGGGATPAGRPTPSVGLPRSAGSAGLSEVAPPGSAINPSPSTEPATAAASTTPGGGFTGSVVAIDAATAARMTPSWRAGCPVPLADLRYLTLTYRGFDGADHGGELIVAASVADEVVATFRQLYEDGYPIASMRLVDDFGGDDDTSMTANNTSAFNCRPVTGGGGFSEHSYGTAIDVNPVQNPYLSGSTVLPAAGRQYVDRPDAPGVIHDGDEVVTAFATHGFSWGGDWTGPIDYQHFSVSGR